MLPFVRIAGSVEPGVEGVAEASWQLTAPDMLPFCYVGYTERVLRDVLADNLAAIAPINLPRTSSNSRTGAT